MSTVKYIYTYNFFILGRLGFLTFVRQLGGEKENRIQSALLRGLGYPWEYLAVFMSQPNIQILLEFLFHRRLKKKHESFCLTKTQPSQRKVNPRVD